MRRGWVLFLLLVFAAPALAQVDLADDDQDIANIAGSGGNSTDPATPARPARGGGRPSPPTLSINPSVWTGLRHRFSPSFLVDVYLKQKFTIRENPYQTPTTASSGGVSGAWLVNGFSLSAGFEVKEDFKEFYGPWNGTSFDLRGAIARQVTLAADWSVLPAFLVSHIWTNPITRERWKIEWSAPLSYALTKELTLQPVIPTISMQAYTHRRVGQLDWTFNLSTGARYQLTPVTMVAFAFGYEQRQSNVPSAEYSRWVLAPKLQLRATF